MWHINSKGEVGRCYAVTQSCPFDIHFESEADAQGYVQNMFEDEHGVLTYKDPAQPIIDEILETAEDDPDYLTDDISEAIYIIDDYMVSGQFDSGVRSIDHNSLIGDGYDWDDILENGTVIVPETESYISDWEIEELEDIGYTRLPLNDNHIVGFKS